MSQSRHKVVILNMAALGMKLGYTRALNLSKNGPKLKRQFMNGSAAQFIFGMQPLCIRNTMYFVQCQG